MKKKILFQTFLIFLIMIIGTFIKMPSVNAADASISVSDTVKKGEKFTVTVNIPSNAVAYQGKITVTYADGSSDTTKDMLIKVTGLDGGAFSHPGNMSATFTAKATGTATAKVEECVISDANWKPLGLPGAKTFNVVENTPPPQQPTTPTTPEQPTTPTTPNNTNTTNNNEKPAEVKFTDVNEAVITNDRVNLRKSYSTSSEKITTLAKDTKLTRTGVSTNGWSRVNYNGQTAYIYSQYLTKDETPTENPEEKEVKITDVNETMYALQNCNLRKSYSTSSDKVGYLMKGQEVTRTGITDNGWSRIKYEGKEVFVSTKLITKEKPEESEEEPTEEPEENQELEAEKTELEILQEEIGVLPEVGNNVATRIYTITTIITLIMCLSGIYYINKKDVK